MYQLRVETPPENVLTSRLANMERRLRSLTKGLLETQEKVESYIGDGGLNKASIHEKLLFGFEVDFLHRTVKDYLQTPEAQLMLETWSGENFNIDLEICTAFGALAKMAPPTSFSSPESMIWHKHIFTFFTFALRLDQNLVCSAEVAYLLDDVQKAILPALRDNKKVIDESFTLDLLRVAEGQSEGWDPDLSIIYACMGFGLSNYVTNKYTKEPQLCHRAANHFPLLLGSVKTISSWGHPTNVWPFPSEAAMLELILSHGVDPNRSFGGQSEWGLYLEQLAGHWCFIAGKPDKLFVCIKVMLRYGANFKQECTAGTEKKKATADELLKEWFDGDQFGVLQDLVKRREGKNKKSKMISKSLRQVQLWMRSKK
jgi:hypothetical protein